MEFSDSPVIAGATSLDQVQRELLQLLQATAGHLSGEQLGAQLGLSRTAIWKRIQRLRAMGYEVTGSSRRGYRLAPGQDLLLPAAITAGLALQWLLGPVCHFVSLPSTNDAAKELARRGYPEGTLLVADSQSAGRGRLGRSWESPPGTGIYLTLLLRPPLPPSELPKLTLTAAVAVVQAVRAATGLATGIKWPNDIIFQGKKLGGILTEMETESEAMSHVVLGVGLNVNMPTFPAPLAGIATSLASTGQTYSRLAIVRALLAALDSLYDSFRRQEFPAILDQWRRASVTLGRSVTVRRGGTTLSGTALDVDPDGALLLQLPAGRVETILSGEIEQASLS